MKKGETKKQPLDTLSEAAYGIAWESMVREAEYALKRGGNDDEWFMTRMDYRAILWANDNLKPKEDRKPPVEEKGENDDNAD